MSGSFINIGLSGLNAAQAGLQNTSHNISNVNTEGFSRQRGIFVTRPPQFSGSGYTGSGVSADAVFRVIDERINLELRNNLSDFNQSDVLFSLASQIDDIVADPDIGLSSAMDGFFGAVHNLNDDPSSQTARQVLINEANTMVQRFQLLNEQLNDQLDLANADLSSYAEEINRLGSSIASMNVQIASSGGDSLANPPNDLLDKRDSLIRELAELVEVTTLRQDDGAINVFIGKGIALVTGGVNQNVVPGIDNFDGDKREVFVRSNTGALVSVTDSIQGGKIGGALEFVNEIAIPSLNTLGLVALGLADSINQQHQLGMDLKDDLGGNFFTDINTTNARAKRVFYGATNTGSALMNVSISDVNSLTGDDYELTFDGTNYRMTNNTDGSVVTTFAEPGAFPTTINIASEGISIEFTSGGAAAGDRFTLTPTRDASADIDVVITDPNALAWASPVDAERLSTNVGSGIIQSVTVTDTSTGAFTTPNQLTPPLEIVFTSATTYDVVNATTSGVIASGAFVPGQDNDMLTPLGLNYGFEVVIAGEPEPGDQFNVDYNNGGLSDNRNGLAIADFQKEKLMSGNTSSIVDIYAKLVGQVGSKTNAAGVSKDATKVLVAQYQARRESVSGVSLDEEAANLIKFQQAYQASAQIISTARTVFDTLITSVR